MTKVDKSHEILDWENVANAWRQNEEKILRPRDGLNQRIIQILNAVPDSNILDFGTGLGVPGIVIAQQLSANVFGLDTSELMLKLALERKLRMGVESFQTINLKSEKFPFESDFFDCGISSFALEFSNRLDSDLEQIRMVLKSGALFIVTCWIKSIDENPFQAFLPMSIENILGSSKLAHDSFFKFSNFDILDLYFKNAQFNLFHREEFSGFVDYDSVEDFWFLKKVVSPAVAKDLALLNVNQISEVENRLVNLFAGLSRSRSGSYRLPFKCHIGVFRKN